MISKLNKPWPEWLIILAWFVCAPPAMALCLYWFVLCLQFFMPMR